MVVTEYDIQKSNYLKMHAQKTLRTRNLNSNNCSLRRDGKTTNASKQRSPHCVGFNQISVVNNRHIAYVGARKTADRLQN